MLSLGWILLLILVGLISIFVAGMALVKDSFPVMVVSALFGLTAVITGGDALVSKGKGQVVPPWRLRPDQVYVVVGVVEHNDGRSVVILDYQNRLLAIEVPGYQLSVVKENQMISVDSNSDKPLLIPFPNWKSAVIENSSEESAGQQSDSR